MAAIIIDITALSKDTSSPEFQKCAKSVVDTLSTNGLMHITTSLLDTASLELILNASRKLFALTVEEKLAVKMTGFTRGYISAGGESGSQQLEWKEGFAFGQEPGSLKKSPLHAPNRWPTGLAAEDRDLLVTFFDKSSEVCMLLTRAIAWVLDQPSMVSLCEGGSEISLMRMFHYFPTNTAPLTSRNPIGSSAHTDWGFLTLILQDNTGGLEFRDADGVWQKVSAENDEHALVVNCGDYLSMLTQGRLKSPLHRVGLPETQYRNSLVYFFYPNYESDLPGDAPKQMYSLLANQSRDNSDEPQVKRQIPFGDYIIDKWQQVHRKGKSY